jgi:lipid-A-disaccharide synthase
VVIYKVRPATWRLAKRIVKLPYIGLVNVVAGRRVVPELLQRDLTADNLARTVRALLEDDALRNQMRANLLDVRRQLGQPGAAARAAELALDLLHSRGGVRGATV